MIKVFGSVKGVDLEESFENYYKSIPEVRKTSMIITYPEFCQQHPANMIRYIRNTVKDAISSDQDLNILTTSELVLLAVRAELKLHELEGQVITFESTNTQFATICKDGRLTYWSKGIFDFWDTLIDELY